MSTEQPKLFATLVWGFDPGKWGAVCFRDKGTLERLKRESGPNDYVLAIASKHKNVDEQVQGCLLALLQFEPVIKPTRSLVDPDFYQQRVQVDGEEKWPFAFPLTGAQKFKSPRPVRSKVLPRFDLSNLHMPLARHYQELTKDEAARILAFPLEPVHTIYRPLIAQSTSSSRTS